MSRSEKETPTVLLIRNAAPQDFGGAETYPVSLAKILAQTGYKPIVVTRSKKLLSYAHSQDVRTIRGWWWGRQDWSGTRIFLFPVYVLWQIFLTTWYMRLISKTRASVVHAQSKDDFIAATIAGRIMGATVVWTDHMDLRYIFQNITRPLRNPVGKMVFWAGSLAHHIILISQNEYQLVTGHFGHKDDLQKQITIINNGVVDLKTQYGEKEKSGDFTFCIASRIVSNKGVGEAIRAFTMLETRLPNHKNLRFAIYGEGAETMKFQTMARGNKHILFYGHQSDALQKINNADVFMLPSYQEGFSIALLEATMLGKAIIASDVDSNAEIIHHMETGLLVPVRDPEALAEAMERVLTDTKLRGQLQLNARKNFEEHFNLFDITTTQITPLYLRK